MNTQTVMSYKDVVDESGIDPAVKYYWGYMYGLAQEYIIPYLESQNVPIKDAAIVEIGSAEGGNLCAMSEHGAAELVGTDIAQVRLDRAEEIADMLGLNITYSPNDIIYQEQPEEWQGHFDIALLRDVIEHLDDPAIALRNIRKLLKPGGVLYVTFPPYYSPFGGHQQLLLNWSSKIPFIHLLPKSLFGVVVANGREADKVEVRRLKEIRMTTTKLRVAAKEAGFSIVDEKLYLLRPVFKMKFGLPAISANMLKPLPGVRDMFALEAGYILKNE